MKIVNNHILNLIIPLQTITVHPSQRLINGRPWPPLSTTPILKLII